MVHRISRSVRAGCLAAAGVVAPAVCGAQIAPTFPGIELPDPGPNVLLVVIDDVGLDKLSPFQSVEAGYVPTAMPNTPNVQDLADAGLMFTNAWANPVCAPTRAGLQTGKYGFRTGITNVTDAVPLDTAEVSLAEVVNGDTDGDGTTDYGPFTRRPYDRGMFGKWHLGTANMPGDPDEAVDLETRALLQARGATTTFAARPNPLRHGYEYFAGSLGGSLRSYWDWALIEGDASTVSVDATRAQTYATDLTAANAGAWIGSQTGPWFATVAFNAGHWDGSNNYDPDHALQGCSTITSASTDLESYQAGVECMDFHLRAMLDTIGDTELADTIIVFVGDNGTDHVVAESVWDQGDPGCPGCYRGKGTVYQNGVRAPLIITDGPSYIAVRDGGAAVSGRVVSPGRSVDYPVNTLDLFATIADLTLSSGTTGTDSISLKPYLDDAAAAQQRRYAYTETYDQDTGIGSAALRGNDFKVIVHVESDGAGGTCRRTEFYHLASDPFEQSDLTGTGDYPFIRMILLNEIFTLDGGSPPAWLDVPAC